MVGWNVVRCGEMGWDGVWWDVVGCGERDVVGRDV